MRITVLYFAVFRERLKRDDDALELPAGATVASAVAALAALHPVIAQLAGKFRVAVNQAFAEDGDELHDNDELVLIPPVAGGTGDAGAERHVVLTADRLSLDRCIAAVTDGVDNVGAVITFTGVIRKHSRGAEIDHLEYEAYAPMAVKVMAEIAAEIEREIAGSRLAVEHRVGALAVGELAVVIAASAPHRAEAFTACRAMIDRLKDRVPIWKKELGENGESWIGLGP